MRYLQLISAMLLALLLASCNTTQKLYEAQEYDQVILRLAPLAKNNRINDRDMNTLAASYHKANQADHERIQALKATGQPDVWPEIYQRYCSMKGRNDALKCFPTKVKKGMNYVKLDLDEDMTVARNHAEAFLVAKANQLLSTGSKVDAEEAEKYVKQLRLTNMENSNLPLLQKKKLLLSCDHVEIVVVGKDERSLLEGFVDAVMAFDEGEIPENVVCSSKWKKPRKGDAQMLVVVNDIQITPNRLDEVAFKEINDGKTVEVTDHSQNKSVTVSGTIKYIDCDGYRTFEKATVPFEVKSTFKNDYTTIKGDREACSAETLNRLDNSHPVPVPTDESMLLDAARKLNDLLAAELRK